MFRYIVTLQEPSGEVLEVPYSVRWDPEKVGPELVARSCAAEHVVAGGKDTTGQWRRPCLPLTARLVPLEEELEELTAS